uniref:Ovule protein n=1 Tax=Panagrellus redivivus TaxID=6233 RepID=A0A7E4VZT0_PANRE
MQSARKSKRELLSSYTSYTAASTPSVVAFMNGRAKCIPNKRKVSSKNIEDCEKKISDDWHGTGTNHGNDDS